MPIKVAVVGVGNFCSALVQGLYYYKDAKEEDGALGFLNITLDKYGITDIEIVAAFDIDTRKVGNDLSAAIFAEPNNVPKFAEIADAFSLPTEGLDDLGAVETAIDAIERLAEDLRVPRHLADFGITEKDIPELAEGVMKVTRLLANNPRTMTLEDAKEIYKAAL